MPSTPKSVSFLWLGIIFTPILGLAFSQSVQPNDYWWYVRLGEEILTTNSIPQIDTFSYTQFGQPMVYHSWLSAVVFALLYQLGGVPLAILLKGGLLAIFYLCIWRVCRLAGAGARLASLCMLLAALASCNNWTVRPQLFSYAFFGLTFWLLYRWEIGNKRGIWLLPLVMLLWVNMHGAFILGFLLVGAAVLFGQGDRRTLILVLSGMVIATLVTPRLWGSWEYVWTLITDPSSQQFSNEWHPPTTETWLGKLFFAWLLFFPLLIHFSPHRLTRLHWVWFLGLGWMALSGIRYVIWFVALLTLLTSYLVQPLLTKYLDKPVHQVKPVINISLSLFFLLFSGLFLPGVRHVWWPEARPTLSPDTPVEATAWLARHQSILTGPLWADLTFASYHVYALPSYPVWIDTRFELYPTEHWERYLEISTAAPRWAELLDEEGINLLMLHPKEQGYLVQALQKNQETWGLCYADEVALLFVRLNGRPLPDVCHISNPLGALTRSWLQILPTIPSP